MIFNHEDMVFTLRIISNDVLESSNEDDETLIQKNIGNIITRKCIVCPGDGVEGFIIKHGLVGFYLRLRILENDIVSISRYITLSAKDDIIKTTDLYRSKKIEIIAKPIPPGIIKRDGIVEDYSITRLGEHFLHKNSSLGWIKRYLALGRMCSYPFSFSGIAEIEKKTPILYFFDQEDLFEPVSAFRLDHIEDISVDNRSMNMEYDLGSQSLNSTFYHWSLKLSSKQFGSTKLNLKSTRLDHINKTISAILMMQQRSKDNNSKINQVDKNTKTSKHDSINTSRDQNIPHMLKAFHWYIEEVIDIMTCNENAQYISIKGIFRISGRLNIIEELYDKIHNPMTIPGDLEVLSQLNELEAHDLAGLLKKLVREYPGRLISCNMSKWLLLPLSKTKDPPSDRIMNIFSPLYKNKEHEFEYTKDDCHRLKLLIRLMKFLKQVSEYSIDQNSSGSDSDDGGNMMDAHNLAIIFAPNLFDMNQDQSVTSLKKKNTNADQIHDMIKYMTCMIQFLIDHVSELCE